MYFVFLETSTGSHRRSNMGLGVAEAAEKNHADGRARFIGDGCRLNPCSVQPCSATDMLLDLQCQRSQERPKSGLKETRKYENHAGHFETLLAKLNFHIGIGNQAGWRHMLA